MSRTFSTSSIQRDVIQANGQAGSNQKSALLISAQPLPGAGHSRQSRATVTAPARGWPVAGCNDLAMPGTNLTRDEAQARAALLDVTSYAIELDLTTGATTFASTTTIEFTSTTARCLDVRRPGRRDRPRDHAQRCARSTRRRRTPTAGSSSTTWPRETTLVVRADCTYSRTGEGLHRFVDPVDDRVYTYTQFEVPDARRVFTTFEQPDLKGVFTFHVTAPASWVVVSNARHPRAAGRRATAPRLWHFPRDQADVDVHHRAHRRRVPRGARHLRAASTATSRSATTAASRWCEHLDADELVKITKQGFAFFEDAFDYPYPFGKYDQLYVPEYNMGAMENAGCVTLRDEYLPRSRQPRSFYEFRANVILHEMAHMWFGDLVTMKWWDDLWLNESFAEWACYHAEVEATEYTESWTGFTNARKNWAYRQDQLPSTHPIAADNYDLQAVEVNFDGITYAKGASVLKQLVAWVGLDQFLEGLRSYFKDHAYGNSEFADLLSALEKSSGPRARVVGPGVAADLRRQHPRAASSRSTTTAPTRPFARRARPRRPSFPTLRRHRHRHRPLRPGRRPRWSAVPRSRSTSTATPTDVPELVGETAARPAAAQRRRPRLRQDPPRRALAGDRRRAASPRSTTRWPGRCAGAPRGT